MHTLRAVASWHFPWDYCNTVLEYLWLCCTVVYSSFPVSLHNGPPVEQLCTACIKTTRCRLAWNLLCFRFLVQFSESLDLGYPEQAACSRPLYSHLLFAEHQCFWPHCSTWFSPHIGSAGLLCPRMRQKSAPAQSRWPCSWTHSVTPVPHHMTFTRGWAISTLPLPSV